MKKLKYEHVEPVGRAQAERYLESADPEVVACALYAVTRSDEDADWLTHVCLELLKSPELRVRWAAATCLGDLAFSRRPIDADKVIQALEAATRDPSIADPAGFSLSLVRQFST